MPIHIIVCDIEVKSSGLNEADQIINNVNVLGTSQTLYFFIFVECLDV